MVKHSCRLVRVVAAAATNASHSTVSSSAAGSLIAADADPSAPAASTGVPAAVLSRRRILRWYIAEGVSQRCGDRSPTQLVVPPTRSHSRAYAACQPESPDGNRTVYRKKKPVHRH